MNLYHIDSFKDPVNIKSENVLALGFFDGVHIGHQKIISSVIEIAHEGKLKSALLTFNNHPLEIIHPGLCFPYITTRDEKIHFLNYLGLDLLFEINFTKEFSQLKAEVFIEEILLNKIKSKIFVLGDNYHFGYRAKGTPVLLKEITGNFNNDKVLVLDRLSTSFGKVSSSSIREFIMSGDIDKANSCLGRFYSLEGIVKYGKQRGRTLNIPTANLDVTYKKVFPRPGVYSGFASIDNKIYDGIGHIGTQPTFNENRYATEIHIFNFSGNLYNKKVRFFFIKHIRDTYKFENIKSMLRQIREDIKISKDHLRLITPEEKRLNLKYWPSSF